MLEKIINTVVIPLTDLQLLLSCFVSLNVYSKVFYTTHLLHIIYKTITVYFTDSTRVCNQFSSGASI